MEQKELTVRKIILGAKPINLYGYAIIISFCILGYSFLYTYFTESHPGVTQVVALTMLVPIFSYIFRFYWSRNNKELRRKIESAETEDEATRLIFGGYLYGVSMVLIMGVVFYATLKAFAL